MSKSRHMTQTELAKRLGVSRTTISYWHSRKMIPEPERINNRPAYSEEYLLELVKIRGIKIQ